MRARAEDGHNPLRLGQSGEAIASVMARLPSCRARQAAAHQLPSVAQRPSSRATEDALGNGANPGRSARVMPTSTWARGTPAVYVRV
jgi:hypothetical protein